MSSTTTSTVRGLASRIALLAAGAWAAVAIAATQAHHPGNTITSVRADGPAPVQTTPGQTPPPPADPGADGVAGWD
jgi:hypothetical protein